MPAILLSSPPRATPGWLYFNYYYTLRASCDKRYNAIHAIMKCWGWWRVGCCVSILGLQSLGARHVQWLWRKFSHYLSYSNEREIIGICFESDNSLEVQFSEIISGQDVDKPQKRTERYKCGLSSACFTMFARHYQPPLKCTSVYL